MWLRFQHEKHKVKKPYKLLIFPELLLKITHRKGLMLRHMSPNPHPLRVLNLTGAMTTMETVIRAINLYFNRYIRIQPYHQMVNVTQGRYLVDSVKIYSTSAIMGFETGNAIWQLLKPSSFFFFFFFFFSRFFFLAAPMACGSSWPGIEPLPQHQPEPLQGQSQILNLPCDTRIPKPSFVLKVGRK